MVRASLIVAMTPEGLIGRDGDMPWHHSEDLRHFKRKTLGGTVLMGRNTWASLGRPLPNRTNLVVSRTLVEEPGPEGTERDGARVFASLEDAVAWVGRERPGGDDHVWVIGGGQLYRDVLAPLDEARSDTVPMLEIDRIVVTWVPALPIQAGDVHFPFDVAWISRHFDVHEDRVGDDGSLRFVDYRRAGRDHDTRSPSGS